MADDGALNPIVVTVQETVMINANAMAGASNVLKQGALQTQ
jgi:hypothetical protein